MTFDFFCNHFRENKACLIFSEMLKKYICLFGHPCTFDQKFQSELFNIYMELFLLRIELVHTHGISPGKMSIEILFFLFLYKKCSTYSFKYSQHTFPWRNKKKKRIF